jgi:glycosyltransferase involved in cell wall biosynthesis
MSGQGKIVIASLSKAYFGKVTSVDDLVADLDRDRFEVIFVFLSGRDDEPTWMEKAGHKVFYLCPNREIRLFRPSLVVRLMRILRSNNVDVLHCHSHKACSYGVLAGTLAKTPSVLVQVHGLHRARNVRRQLVNFFMFRGATRVVAVSQAVKQDILATNWRVPAERLSVLEDSVDYDRFAHCAVLKTEARKMLGVPSDGIIFGTVGRLTPTKGLPYLIEAFCMVREQIPCAHLVLLGDGSERAQIERQARESPHRDAIHFLGRRDHIEQFLRGMDVFVLSSVAEGVGRALLEAMAAGVPAVATQVGGIPEVIHSPEVGLLAPPRDPQTLAQMMIRMGRMSESQRAAIGRAAQERIRQFYSHDVIREKLRRIYEEEYENHRSRARDSAKKDVQRRQASSWTDH